MRDVGGLFANTVLCCPFRSLGAKERQPNRSRHESESDLSETFCRWLVLRSFDLTCNLLRQICNIVMVECARRSRRNEGLQLFRVFRVLCRQLLKLDLLGFWNNRLRPFGD